MVLVNDWIEMECNIVTWRARNGNGSLRGFTQPGTAPGSGGVDVDLLVRSFDDCVLHPHGAGERPAEVSYRMRPVIRSTYY